MLSAAAAASRALSLQDERTAMASQGKAAASVCPRIRLTIIPRLSYARGYDHKKFLLIAVVGFAGICISQAQSPTPAEPPSPSQTPAKNRAIKNTDTHVYHKEGSRFYGTTKEGKYMTEADAVKAGNKPGSERR